MSYVGNPSLNDETKARIQTTFGQTLQLAEAGRLQEAALGCDFILKMDPQFAPARSLLDRLDGASGPLDVSDLLPAPAPAPAAPRPPAPSPAASSPAAPSPAAPAPAAPPAAAPPRPSAPAPASGDGGLPPLPPRPADGGSGGGLGGLDLGAPSLGEPSLGGPSLDGPSLDAPSPATGAPSPPPPAATSGGADDERIQALLDEGQSSFEVGAYQAAIDAWSRIFLIDIDHAEASRRIEEARQRKDESEREVEERFHAAVDRLDAGETAAGRAMLEEVLQLHPEHHGARQRLEALDAPAAADPTPLSEPLPEPLPDPGADFGEPLPDVEGGRSGPARLEMPPLEPAAPPPRRSSSGGLFAERRFLLIGAGALVLVVIAGAYLFLNWSSLFPNGPALEAPAEPVEPAGPGPIVEATKLYNAGDIEGAVALLDGVAVSSPRYQQARVKAEEWRAELAAAAAVTDAGDEAAAAAAEELRQTRRRVTLLESARRHYAEGSYLLAAKAINAASRIAPLDGPTADLFEDSKRQLVPIQQQITLFRSGEWERMQGPLWRILESDPNNRDARLLLTDSYFNLGVQALRRGQPDEAVAPLQEAASLTPEDPLLDRLFLLASTYASTQSLDELYNIFVEELEYRR